MIQDHVLSLLVIIALGGLFFYKFSYLKSKRILRLNLHQILYLFVLPSIVAILIHSYVISLIQTDSSPDTFFPDGLLVNLVFLSILYIFAGQAIHVVTKALSDAGLKEDQGDAGKLNHFLHLTFSHNFLFASTLLLVTSLAILEINHITDYSYSNWINPIFRGLALGLAFLGSMYNYTRPDYKEQYRGMGWSDLKLVFAISWIAFIVVISASQSVDFSFRSYQFLLPTLLILALVNTFNIILLLRRLRLKRISHSVLEDIDELV